MENRLFDFLQLALGLKKERECLPQSRDEWDMLFNVAAQHNLVAVTFPLIDELHDEELVPLGIYSRWAMMAEKVQEKNANMNKVCVKLFNLFKDNGMRSCVLKGQGAAALYPHPELRQCGDIDIWVDADRNTTLDFLRSHGGTGKVFYHHCEPHMVKGISTEVHFLPSWMNAPIANRRLQKYFRRVAPAQFENYNPDLGFCVPTLQFQAVHMLIHIYRHVLDEGVGLRQLMDYYYVLKALTPEDRVKVLRDLDELKMKIFAAGIMYVLKMVFGIEDRLLLCEPDSRQGAFLLDEIMISGNFGRYDIRNKHEKNERRVMHAKRKITRSLRYLKYYPTEVIGIPYFMIKHYFWRLFKGYLQ